MVDPYAESQMLAPDAYYQDFWNYAGWYGEEAARQTYGAYAPPVGSQPPAAEPAVPGVEPAAPGVAASPAPAAGAQTYGAAPLTYAPDYAAAPPGVTPPPAPTGVMAGFVAATSPAAPAGRGRGVSNLPAWMTNAEAPAPAADPAADALAAALATPGAPVPPAPGT